ncbi:MAG: hypothetical protein LBI58_03325 [Tannerellaceae bacterium]|jgi:hypothetical protein|nr:hypothetical protein [Tannerellaceae bacterium]
MGLSDLSNQETKQSTPTAIALDKLDAYKTAGATGDAFIADVARFNGLSNKERAQLEGAPLVYGRVVQANTSLYKPGSGGRAGIVFLFATDDRHRYDKEWLRATADRISGIKESVDKRPRDIWDKVIDTFDMEKNVIISHFIKARRLKGVPEDCRKLIASLRDYTSYFCLPLAGSLGQGATAWCATYTLEKQSSLPLGCIPQDRIIPFLLSEPPRKDQFAAIQLIPPSYYTR